MRLISLILLCVVCFTGCSQSNEETAVKEAADAEKTMKVTESSGSQLASTNEPLEAPKPETSTDLPLKPVTGAEKTYVEFMDVFYEDINTSFHEVMDGIDELVNPNDENSRMYAFDEEWNAKVDKHLNIIAGILEHLQEMETVPELYVDHHYNTKTGLILFLSSIDATREASIQADPELLQEAGSLYLEAFTHLAQVPQFYPEKE